jgi:hypothetical protein
MSKKLGITAKATTVWLEESLIERLRDYAYTERISIREAITRAVEAYLKDKEIIKRPER